ncbi:unnamed protein product, partial [Prorocentrum cordatum]
RALARRVEQSTSSLAQSSPFYGSACSLSLHGYSCGQLDEPMDILSPHGEETTSVQALRKALLSLGSDRSEADFPTDGGFSERVPLKVLILTQATHRLFEALEDGPTKVPAKRKQVVSGPWVPAEDVVKAGGATGKPAPFPSISRTEHRAQHAQLGDARGRQG